MTGDESPVAIDLERNDLLDSLGRVVPLRRRSLGVLMRLASNVDRVVTKEELVEANWPGRAVSDDSLARCVSDIRAVLGPELRKTVRTVSGRGYMLCGWRRSSNEDRLLAPAAVADGSAFQAASGDERPSIAVLPFTSLGEEDASFYFADGVVEEIIGALSRVRWFFVIAKGSSFTYRDSRLDMRGIGRELGVRYILNGTVRRAGERIRLSGQLVEAETGRQL